MKKNISINLQGIIFHIEDDGYEVLSRYLQEVKKYFASYQGHEEIVADIEGRIAELFSARLSASKQVITLADVEELTAKMGRVSDFAPEPDEEDMAADAAGATGPGGTFGPNGPFGAKGSAGSEGPFGPKGPFGNGPAIDASGQPRRLYRDLAHRKIAGVCAGLAQYFMVNPLVVRLIFLALLLLPNVFGIYDHIPGTGVFRHRFDFGGLALIAYIVLWVVLPKRDDAPAPIDTLDLGGSLTGRKLFRDIDTGKVGGVASGLAFYFRTDVVLMRALFLLGAFFTFGSTIILYIILWAVVPEARTVSEKMQMRGDAVTLSGIDNSLRASAFDLDNVATPTGRPVGTFLEGAARTARPAVSFVGTVIRWVVGLLLIFWGGSWLFGVLTALGVALSIIPFSAMEYTSNGFMFDNEFGELARNLSPWGAVAGALLIGIPGLGILLLGLRLLLRRPVLGRSAGGVLLGLWLLGLVGSAVAGLQVARDFQAKGTYTTTVRFAGLPGRDVVLDSRNLEEKTKWVNLHLAPANSSTAPYVEEEFRANGRTQDAARLTAQQTILYHIEQRDSTITFDQGFQLKDNAPFRNQRLTLTLYLPVDKTYRLTPLFLEHLDDDDFTGNRRPRDNQAHRARFTAQGKFECLDCPAADDEASDDRDEDDDHDEVVNLDVNGAKTEVRVNTDGDEPTVRIHSEAAKFSPDPATYGTGRKTLNSPGSFDEVEVRGAVRLLLRQGAGYKVEAAGRTQDLDYLRLETTGDRLVVAQRTNSLLSGFNFSSQPILVTVTVPTLQRLNLSGACQADVSGFNQDNLRLEATGASSARLDVHVPSLTLDLSGACAIDLRGAATELLVDGSGVCQVNGLALQAQRANVELRGMSQAKVRAATELKVDLSGSSHVRYAGSPGHIEKDLSGASSLEEVKD